MAKKGEGLSLIQKLSKIRAHVDVMQRTKKGFNYKYIPLDEILANITGVMEEYRVSLIPSITPGTSNVRLVSFEKLKTTKTGQQFKEPINEYVVTADTKYIWVNDDDPDDTLEIEWAMSGAQSDPSQAFGSGLTYSFRYFLTNYFQIAQTEEDPDNWRSKQREAEAREDRENAEAIIKEVDVAIRTFLGKNPDEAKNVKALTTRYASNGNYLVISDPRLASSLLADFREQFLGEKADENQEENKKEGKE